MRQQVVLFVDDEKQMLRSIERIVLRESYGTRFVSSGTEALATLQREHIDVIVADMKMPLMDGVTLLRQVKKDYPHVVRVVLSGFAQISQVLAAVNKGELFRFLTKPVDEPDEFKEVIRNALESAVVQRRAEEQNDCVRQVMENLPGLSDKLAQLSGELRSRGDDETARECLLDRLDEACNQLRSISTSKSGESEVSHDKE